MVEWIVKHRGINTSLLIVMTILLATSACKQDDKYGTIVMLHYSGGGNHTYIDGLYEFRSGLTEPEEILDLNLNINLQSVPTSIQHPSIDISPDKRYMVIGHYLLDRETGVSTMLPMDIPQLDPAALEEDDLIFINAASFSPNSKLLAYSVEAEIDHRGYSCLYILEVKVPGAHGYQKYFDGECARYASGWTNCERVTFVDWLDDDHLLYEYRTGFPWLIRFGDPTNITRYLSILVPDEGESIQVESSTDFSYEYLGVGSTVFRREHTDPFTRSWSDVTSFMDDPSELNFRPLPDDIDTLIARSGS